jgi:hypothetical protein
MTEPDDGRFKFSTWNIYPRVSDYDRTWHVSAIDTLRLIHDSCFWMFVYLPSAGLWPSMTGVKVDYSQLITAAHVPLKINGWQVASGGERDVTLAYKIRPEAEPDSAPLFAAEIRWQTIDLGVAAAESTLSTGAEEFRSSSGTLF